MLITSRNQSVLGPIDKDSVFRISGLDNDGGIKLLSLVLGDTRVNDDIESATQIIKILGGMPLAIEIAARHLCDIPDLSFSDYIGQIQNKIGELKIDSNEDKNVLASLNISIDQICTLSEGRELLELFEAASICPKSGFTSDFLKLIVKDWVFLCLRRLNMVRVWYSAHKTKNFARNVMKFLKLRLLITV